MRSSQFSLGLALSLVVTVSARIAAVHERDLTIEEERGFLQFVQRYFKAKKPLERRDQVCVEDSYYTFLSQWPAASSFCSGYISIATQTVTTDYTPTS